LQSIQRVNAAAPTDTQERGCVRNLANLLKLRCGRVIWPVVSPGAPPSFFGGTIDDFLKNFQVKILILSNPSSIFLAYSQPPESAPHRTRRG
jgi:hypothetical protein